MKINVVVFDNPGFQCIDNLQQSQGIVKFGNELRNRDPPRAGSPASPDMDFARTPRATAQGDTRCPAWRSSAAP